MVLQCTLKQILKMTFKGNTLDCTRGALLPPHAADLMWSAFIWQQFRNNLKPLRDLSLSCFSVDQYFPSGCYSNTHTAIFLPEKHCDIDRFFLPCSPSSVLKEVVTQETALWPSALCRFASFYGSNFVALFSTAVRSIELTFRRVLKEVWDNLFVGVSCELVHLHLF